MKLPSNDLTKWLLGAMLAALFVLLSMVWMQLNNRLDRIEAKQLTLDQRIVSVQLQYAKIDTVIFRLEQIEEELKKRR